MGDKLTNNSPSKKHNRAQEKINQRSEMVTPSDWIICVIMIGNRKSDPPKNSSHRLQPRNCVHATYAGAPILQAIQQIDKRVHIAKTPCSSHHINTTDEMVGKGNLERPWEADAKKSNAAVWFFDRCEQSWSSIAFYQKSEALTMPSCKSRTPLTQPPINRAARI